MFFTIGLILGFAIGWWVNEKVENLADRIQMDDAPPEYPGFYARFFAGSYWL